MYSALSKNKVPFLLSAIGLYKNPSCGLLLPFPAIPSLLEQVLWPAGSRLRPTWEREKAGKRRKRTSAETPAASRRMRARVTPIRCVAARLAAYWPAKALARLAEQLCIK